jgi:acetyl esterase
MRLLAGRSGWAVCAVAYGLAPEHRYPVQLEQALAVIGWLGTAAAGLGLEVGRLALGGDSAGANLALAAQVALRDRGGPPVRRGLLFYGMYDLDFETDSYRRFGDGAYGLSRERMAWFWSQYLGREPVSAPPLAVPARARLHGLAPQLVIGAGLDCLLDDSRVLAAALERAGVPNTLTVYPGVPHSFVQMSAFVAAADRAVDQAAAFLRNAAVPGGEDAAGKELGT